MRNGSRQVRSPNGIAVLANAEHDQFSAFSVGDLEDFVCRRAVRYHNFRWKREAWLVFHEKVQAVHRGGFKFMRRDKFASLEVINYMQQREMRCMFVREADCVSNCERRGFAEIRGIENFAEFQLARRLHGNVRADCEHGAIGTAKDVFRRGPEDEFADAAAAAGAEDNKIGFLCLGDGFDHSGDAAFDDDNFGFGHGLNLLE